jgi:hypothetical protein
LSAKEGLNKKRGAKEERLIEANATVALSLPSLGNHYVCAFFIRKNRDSLSFTIQDYKIPSG